METHWPNYNPKIQPKHTHIWKRGNYNIKLPFVTDMIAKKLPTPQKMNGWKFWESTKMPGISENHLPIPPFFRFDLLIFRGVSFLTSEISWWFFQYFLCSSRTLGRWSQFHEHIFQMGWNHQPRKWLFRFRRGCFVIFFFWRRRGMPLVLSWCLSGLCHFWCWTLGPYKTWKRHQWSMVAVAVAKGTSPFMFIYIYCLYMCFILFT